MRHNILLGKLQGKRPNRGVMRIREDIIKLELVKESVISVNCASVAEASSSLRILWARN
jgi:hypothetical protein